MKTILLTNDDGFLSPGIKHLREYLLRHFKSQYDVYIVAPDRERSGISMSITINHPIRLKQRDEKIFSIDGTPVDCINIALQKILPQPPDFVISGMNAGENICEDVFFSGTVAAAYVGHLYGFPSMASSVIPDRTNGKFNYEEGARITAEVLSKVLPLNNTKIVYNLNIPSQNTGRVMITSLGLKQYKSTIVERIDPRDQEYYWTGTGDPLTSGAKGTDLHAIAEGNISLSVLKYDLNEFEELRKLSEVFNDKTRKN